MKRDYFLVILIIIAAFLFLTFILLAISVTTPPPSATESPPLPAAMTPAPAPTEYAEPTATPRIEAATIESHVPRVLDPPPEYTEPPEPAAADVEMIAKTIYGEANGIDSDMERAAVAWCILNRVDNPDPIFPDTIAEVIQQKAQFNGYAPEYPVTERNRRIARDVLIRWVRERDGESDVGRVLPIDYIFFTGDGEHNNFRREYRTTDFWGWELPNPYNN